MTDNGHSNLGEYVATVVSGLLKRDKELFINILPGTQQVGYCDVTIQVSKRKNKSGERAYTMRSRPIFEFGDRMTRELVRQIAEDDVEELLFALKNEMEKQS